MKNPFTLNVYPDIFVGYDKQKEELLSSLNSEEKYILIIGDIGVGKTTMVRWLLRNKKGVYFPRPPAQMKEVFNKLKSNIFSRVINAILKKNSNKIIIIDEFHEANKEFIEDLRSYLDLVDNISVIFVILPKFEEYLREKYASLYSRITTKIYLTRLNKNETFQLIKQRVNKFGGRGIEPFTSDAVDIIFEKSRGIPREILKLCSYYFKIARDKNIDVIDRSFIISHENEGDPPSFQSSVDYRSVTFTPISSSDSFNFTNLTPKQKEIIELIKKHKALSPPEIVSLINKDTYSSELHALRAVNNILRKLEAEGLLKRKRSGRRYVYYIDSL